MEPFDLCVIGAGPGGYVAALRAARSGLRTALVEKAFPGGSCLNCGCIPTKTLIAGAGVFARLRKAAEFGIRLDGAVSVDWPAMLQRKNTVVEKLRSGISFLLDGAGVSRFQGRAEFLNQQEILIAEGADAGKHLSAKKWIVAVGSEPAMPGFLPKCDRILSSTDLLNLPVLPRKLLILGGGVIGCEFACLFAALGIEVTVVEMQKQLLGAMDGECARQLLRGMKMRGIRVMTGKPLEQLVCSADGVYGKVGMQTVDGDYLLVSVGRRPVTRQLGLDAAGVACEEHGFIKVDEAFRTSVPDIYAIGDAVGKVQLAHWASASAEIAVADILGKKENLPVLAATPACVFTTPEIASVGKSEEQCEAENLDYKIGKFPFSALGKALAEEAAEGFVKILADEKNDRILGVHIVGAHAGDLIAEATALLVAGATAAELCRVIHAHPTLAEGMAEAAHAVHGECVHLPSPRRKMEKNTETDR